MPPLDGSSFDGSPFTKRISPEGRHKIQGAGGAVSNTDHVIWSDHLSLSNIVLAAEKACVGLLDVCAPNKPLLRTLASDLTEVKGL